MTVRVYGEVRGYVGSGMWAGGSVAVRGFDMRVKRSRIRPNTDRYAFM